MIVIYSYFLPPVLLCGWTDPRASICHTRGPGGLAGGRLILVLVLTLSLTMVLTLTLIRTLKLTWML